MLQRMSNYKLNLSISEMCVYNGLDGVNLGSCKYHYKSEFDFVPKYIL